MCLHNQVLLLLSPSKFRFRLIWQEKFASFSELLHSFWFLKVTREVHKNKLSHDVRLLVFPAPSLARCAATVAFLMVFGPRVDSTGEPSTQMPTAFNSPSN